MPGGGDIMPIKVDNLTVYADRGRKHVLLRDMNCSMLDRTITLVIGKAGSGKSTLLRALAGLKDFTQGEIYYDGIPLRSGRQTNRALLLRSSIAFQFPEHQLFARTLQGEFDYSLRPYRLPFAEKTRRITTALGGQGMPDSSLSQSPFILSGGQKRRAALATITAAETPWLLLDEPSAGLDTMSLSKLKQELVQWKQTRGIILVTHDVDAFLPIADRVIIIHAGQITGDLTPEELSANPRLLQQAGVGLTESMEVQEYLRELGLQLPAGSLSPEQLALAISNNAATGAVPRLASLEGAKPAYAELVEAPATPPSDASSARAVYQMDVKLKWLIYMAASLVVILQKQWLGISIALFLSILGSLALLYPEDRRRLVRMSRPLLILTALAIALSGIQLSFEQGLDWLERIGFSMQAALETMRRLLILFVITILGLIFTLTTSTSSMKQGLELLLRPLKKIGAPAEMLALAASLVLRFIPTILEEADRFAAIAKARGKRTASRGRIDIRDIPTFVIPLLMALFQSVEELIVAMELKGFIQEEKR
jgi:energy-coupling factor transport system permease/ATP-binding protein